jgi:hypothetical protein
MGTLVAVLAGGVASGGCLTRENPETVGWDCISGVCRPRRDGAVEPPVPLPALRDAAAPPGTDAASAPPEGDAKAASDADGGLSDAAGGAHDGATDADATAAGATDGGAESDAPSLRDAPPAPAADAIPAPSAADADPVASPPDALSSSDSSGGHS